MHTLQHRLASVRRRWRFMVVVRGVSAIAALVVGAAALVGLTDWLVHLPSLVRAYCLVSILGAAGYVAFRWLVVPFWKRCDDLSLAIQIEDAYPELNDALASTVQFLEDEKTPGSPSMRNKAIDKAMDATADLDFGRILDRRGMMYCGLAMLAALAVGGHFAWRHTELTQTALLRLVEPFGDHTWTRIGLDDVPTKIAVGQPFPLRGRVEGIVPQQVRFEIEGINPSDPTDKEGRDKYEKRSEKIVPLKIDATARKGEIVTALDVTQQKGKFRFRVLGNDGRFPVAQSWHEVEVVPPPMFVDLNGQPSPQIALFPPEYTDLPSPLHLSPGTLHLDFIQGTRVFFRAALNRPLSKASIELRPLDPALSTAPLLGLLGHTQPLNATALLAVQQAFSGRYEAALDPSGKEMEVAFQPWVSGKYVIHLFDADGLPKDYERDVRVNPDPVPIVQMQRPGASISLLPDAAVVFKLIADDELALRSVYLEYRRIDAEDKPLEAPRTIVLYDPAQIGWMMARALPGPLPTPPVWPELRLRPKRLELDKTWALAKQFKEGETILVQGCGLDFCNIIVPRQPGRSPAVKLRIVGKSELARQLDEGLGQAQQELVRLQKMQQEAIDLVKDIAKAKEPQQKLDRLIEAEQVQKQIQERIGNRPDEGLREQLGKLDQLIKDNKLPPTEINDQVKELLQDLNRLSQEDMPKIEQSLNESRKELSGTQKPMPPDSKKQAPLDKTKNLQQQAKDKIDEMTRSLDKWADVNLAKSILRDLIQRQEQVAKDTEATQKQAEANEQTPDAKKTKEVVDAIKGQTDAQSSIANKVSDLQKQMEKMLGQQDKGPNKEFQELKKKLLKTQRAEDDKKLADEWKQLAKETRDLAQQQNDDAKAALQQLAKEMEAAANQLEKGKMSQEARDDLPRNLQKQLRQAENQATPQQVKNLKDAVEIGKDAKVPQKLTKSNEMLAEPDFKKAREQQDKALKGMKDQLAALEGQKDDGLDRLQKKQKNLAKLDDNVDKLGKKAQDAKNIKNADEKAEELKNVAKELREQARELQRLQEEKASKELNKAAQALEDAVDKMQQGQPAEAEDLQREADERIKEAKKKIEEFEEELAREQLAKIADRLKGLKERQDAAIDRSKELHDKAAKKREWTRGLQQTLDADKMSQQGLAEETRSLQEKIKEAKVFEHVMDKAAKAMDGAVDAMAKRKEQKRNAPWDDDEAKDEEQRQEKTVKLQTQATQRLQRLLDALKDDLQAAAEKPPMQPMDGGGGDEQPRMRPAGDGIPPMAELKALRAEQVEVNERTKEFALRHPNVDNLNDLQRRELTELEVEQRKLREIFAGMTSDKKGDRP